VEGGRYVERFFDKTNITVTNMTLVDNTSEFGSLPFTGARLMVISEGGSVTNSHFTNNLVMRNGPTGGIVMASGFGGGTISGNVVSGNRVIDNDLAGSLGEAEARRSCLRAAST